MKPSICIVTASWDLHSPCTTENQPALHPQSLTVRPGERHNPQSSGIDREGWDTARMENTEPLKGLGESQDAKNDQEMFHRHRIQATLRRDDTEITGSDRPRKSG